MALAAFNALEKNCSRCHQAGPTLKRAKPAKNFGNILHLDELAHDPNFILPGNPDGSHLFIQIAKKEMPYDCYQEFDCKTEPTEAEVQAVYDWIKSLGDVAVAACTGRKVIDEETIVTDDRRRPRSAAGASPQGHALHHAVEFLYGLRRRNRHGALPAGRGEAAQQPLRRNSDVLKMRTIDPEKTIIAFNLDDLDWTADDWNRIIGTYPYAMKPDVTVYDTVASLTDTPLAWIRGDWFAFTASRPPLYYDLLKLPQSFAELEKDDRRRYQERYREVPGEARGLPEVGRLQA